MSKKEEINKEDLEFLKELFGEPKKEDRISQDFRKLNDLKKKISESSIKDGLIQFDNQSGIIKSRGSIKLESEKANSKYSKKRKIKKKRLFLEIAEALPLIKENNIMLNELIRILSQGSIKVRILK